jgi:hypothetical protein
MSIVRGSTLPPNEEFEEQLVDDLGLLLLRKMATLRNRKGA